MPRIMSAAMKAALEADILYPVYFFEAETRTSTLRLWTGHPGRTAAWNGQDWLGIGWLIGFSEVEETAEVKATSMTVGLAASAELIEAALAELRRNNKVRVFEGFLTPGWSFGDAAATYVLGDDAPAFEIGQPAGMLIEDPIEIFRGQLDIPEIDLQDPAKPSIRIRYASPLADFEKARDWRSSHESQQIDHPGDLFYEFAGKTDTVISWGGS